MKGRGAEEKAKAKATHGVHDQAAIGQRLRRQTAVLYRSLTHIVILTADQDLRDEPLLPDWSLRVGDLFT